MSFILNIDTAVEGASICLADNDRPVLSSKNPFTKDSASWLHPAIKQLLQEASVPVSQISAVAVSAGPGSYTGLRVGMSAAKGICFALNLPLLCISTLKMMAAAAAGVDTGLLAPMIDARRMEVFTAVYRQNLEEVMTPTNMILDEDSYTSLLEENTLIFFGNGSEKFEKICKHNNAFFKQVSTSAEDMTALSFQKFAERDFNDLAYAEPFYGKEFYSPAPKENNNKQLLTTLTL